MGASGHGTGGARQRDRRAGRATIFVAAYRLACEAGRSSKGHFTTNRECLRWHEPIRIRTGDRTQQRAESGDLVRPRVHVRAAARRCRRRSGEHAAPTARPSSYGRNEPHVIVTRVSHKPYVVRSGRCRSGCVTTTRRVALRLPFTRYSRGTFASSAHRPAEAADVALGDALVAVNATAIPRTWCKLGIRHPTAQARA